MKTFEENVSQVLRGGIAENFVLKVCSSGFHYAENEGIGRRKKMGIQEIYKF